MANLKARLALAAACAVFVHFATAAPYTGTAPACSALSTSTCRIDVIDFIKTKYSYQGYTLNYDNHADASANSFRAAAGRRLYNALSDSWTVINTPSVPAGTAKHKTISNVVIQIGTEAGAGKSLGYYVWGAGDVNALHVLSEISYTDQTNSWFKTFTAANVTSYQDDWQNRGYYWSDYKFDVTPAGGGVWTAPDRNKPVHGYLDFNYGNVLLSQRWEGYNPQSGAGNGSGAQRIVSASFYPNMTDPTIINGYGGTLPSTLEVLKLTHTLKNINGTVTTWESFYYGRERLADGSYNYFGLIFFEAALRDTSVCQNGVPTASHPNAMCHAATNTYFTERSSYSAFVSATPATFYSQALSTTYKNDTKFTRRSASDSWGNVQEHAFKTNNRGGFRPQGAGNDSTNSLVLSSDWVYMESNGADQDVYLYADGQDPLSSTQPTPPIYCRSGYTFVGAVVTQQSYSVIKYAGGVRGDWAVSASGTIGTTYPTSPGAHWIAFCASTTTNGPVMYVNASDAGEASCTSGYTPRLWYNANHTGVTACPAGSGCFDGIAKNYINMCVKTSECVGACMGTNNP